MSATLSYLARYPLVLGLLVLVCATLAWQAILLAKAHAATRSQKIPAFGAQINTDNEVSRRPRSHKIVSQDSSKTARSLSDAGLSLSVAAWTMIRAGGALAILVTCLILGIPLIGVVMAIGAVVGTRLWLSGRCRKRASELEKQVLQLEMQMAENSRAGLSVERSLKTCLEHADQPIKDHLERLVNELTYSNRTLSEAFASFAQRTNSNDVAILSSIIAVQQETGANLADTLDFLCETIEEKQRMRLTLRSRIAEMSLTKAMVALAPLIIVGLCCLLIEGVTAFYAENPLGWVLLGVCGGIDLLGVAILGKMSDIPID